MILFNYDQTKEEHKRSRQRETEERYMEILEKSTRYNALKDRNVKHNVFSANNLAMSAEVLKRQKGPHSLPGKDKGEYPFYQLFGEKKYGKLRSGYRLPTKNKRKKKRHRRDAQTLEEKNRGPGSPCSQRLNSVLTQLVSDSHKSKLQQLKRKREIRRQESIRKGIVAADHADTSESWQHFREKPIEHISQRTAIDCGINLIEVEMEKEQARLEREARLGVTGDAGKVTHKSTLQLLYLHNDEDDR